MRYLLTALLTMALLAPFAWSRITLLPSDDTAGGGAGNIYWSQNYGSSEPGAWPSAFDCMKANGGSGNTYTKCDLTGSYDGTLSRPYGGLIYIRKLVCAPAVDITGWVGAGAEMSWGVWEVEGGDDGVKTFDRNQVGGSLQFTAADGARVSKTLTINTWTTISDGSLQVGLVTDTAPSSGPGSGFNCTVYGIE